MPSNPHDVLHDAVQEAIRIVNRHNGIHRLHEDAQGLIFMERCALKGLPVDLDRVELVMRRMRAAAFNGYYPKESGLL